MGTKSTLNLKTFIGHHSTTEQKTGRKWIDGRDIYRKTFDTAWGGTTGVQSFPHGITDLDLIVQPAQGFFQYSSSNHKRTIPMLPSSSSSNGMVSMDRWDGTNLSGAIGSDYSGANGINRLVFTIEYVKTT